MLDIVAHSMGGTRLAAWFIEKRGKSGDPEARHARHSQRRIALAEGR